MIETSGEWLSRDIAPWGGLYSPLLSWIGAIGLIAFVGWQTIRLHGAVREARALCLEIDHTLARLLKERRVTQRDPLSLRHAAVRTPHPNNSRDLDDLGALDRLMGEDAAVFQAWTQYRKTLVLEPVAWFQEPRIFSTCHSEEFFTFERLFACRIHQAWYGHVPSFVTGVSLLLTFIALLIGLSHLHADEQGIQGLQGLINGLAGKFLTSIVGLICANLFSLIEKHVIYRLVTAHQDLVNSIECIFPRKTQEQWVDERDAWHRTMKEEKTSPSDLKESLQNLGLMIQSLTTAVQRQTLALEMGSDDAHEARPFESHRLMAISTPSSRS